MFWKKKNPDADALNHRSNDQRDTFRYDYKPGQGFGIVFKETQVAVLNISAGGLAFSSKMFKPLDFDYIRFTLDIPNFTGDTSFFAGLRILKIDQNDLCHCVFEQCSLEQQELIHKYVLEMQKNDLAH